MKDHKFTPLLKSVFDKYDSDKSEYLTYKEFRRFIYGLAKHTNIDTSEISIKSAFALLDGDGNGKITFDEFESWWIKENKYDIFCGTKNMLLRKAYSLYKQYTSDRNMTIEDFSRMMKDLDLEFDREEFENLVNNSGVGYLTFEQFVRWLRWF